MDHNMLIQEKPSIEKQELERMILQEAKNVTTFSTEAYIIFCMN